jgi:hypothetical protein
MNDSPDDLDDSSRRRSFGWVGWASLLLVVGLTLVAALLVIEMIGQRDREAAAYLQLHVPEGVEIEYDVWKSTLKALVTHRIVLTAAISKPEILDLPAIKCQADPTAWLQRYLHVSYPGNADIMKISLSEYDRRQNAILVNAVVDAFMTEVVDAERKNRDEKIAELTTIKVEKAEELRRVLADLRSFRRESEESNADESQRQANDNRLSRIRERIVSLQKALDEITAKLEKMAVESRTAPRVTILQKAEVPK